MTCHLCSRENWPLPGQTSVWITGFPVELRRIAIGVGERYGDRASVGPTCWDPEGVTDKDHFRVIMFKHKNDAMMFKLSVP